jgi:hypothetical protein
MEQIKLHNLASRLMSVLRPNSIDYEGNLQKLLSSIEVTYTLNRILRKYFTNKLPEMNCLVSQWEISALPPRKWTFGEWKAVVVRIYMLQKWNAQKFLRKAKFHTEKEAKWTSKPLKSKDFRLPFLISQHFLIKVLS